jgi:glycosyltransferase involved in cell wall biosynthesis
MRILEVTPYFHPHYGGVESHVLGLSMHLQQRGHTIEVVTSRYARMPVRETVCGLPVNRVTQWLNLFNTPVAPGFGGHIAATEADVVHVHSPPPFTELFAARGARKAGKPLVITYHCDLELRGRLGSLMVRGYQRYAGQRPLQAAKRIISTTESYAATSRALWNREV